MTNDNKPPSCINFSKHLDRKLYSHLEWPNTGMSALPDMYARAQGHTAPEGKCGYIRECTSSCVATNM